MTTGSSDAVRASAPAPAGNDAGWLSPARVAAQAKRALERRLYGDSFWNLYRRLEMFVPQVIGPGDQIVRLAFQAAEQTLPRLAELAELSGTDRSRVLDAEAFCESEAEREAARALKDAFDRHGSDKARFHNYHLVYGAVLTRLGAVEAMLEVGLGTNHEDAVSNMGATGRPGASLRAFREILPGARICGADVDRRILFQEERIRTVFIDQTDPATFAEAEAMGPFDLVIDDGLHAPNANLAVLALGLRRLKPRGWIVVEDITPHAMPLWRAVSAVLPADYRTSIVRTSQALLVAFERAAA